MASMQVQVEGVQDRYVLWFASLFNPGRGVKVPCDEAGQVNLDELPDRLRNAYFGARALIGRDYGYPTVQASGLALRPRSPVPTAAFRP